MLCLWEFHGGTYCFVAEHERPFNAAPVIASPLISPLNEKDRRPPELAREIRLPRMFPVIGLDRLPRVMLPVMWAPS
jgi:hypothetical protein